MSLLSQLPQQRADVILLRVVASLDTEVAHVPGGPRARSGWRRIAA
jgi:hypothetical protein